MRFPYLCRTSRTALLAICLAGLITAPWTSAGAQPSQAAYALSTRLTAAMEQCWFGPNATDFAGYVYSSEPNAAGGPRILIVPKDAPTALPVLVIEITMPGGNPHLNVYGPLAGGAQAPRIAADLRRWMGGSTRCQ